MAEEIIKKTNQIDVKSEERDFNRFGEEGNVALKFGSHVVRGRLINISTGGILCVFNSKDSLPEISQNVEVSLETDDKGSVFEVEGTVIRIQPAPSPSAPEDIDIAVKFINLTPQKNHEIKNVLIPVMTKSRVRKYFEPLIELD